jgi:F0F1-type ATP synthase assembly protein I
VKPDAKHNERPVSTLGNIGPYLSLGLELALYLLVFIFIGRFLDRRYGTEPWLMIAGAALGFAGGFYALIRTLGRLSRSEKGKGPG